MPLNVVEHSGSFLLPRGLIDDGRLRLTIRVSDGIRYVGEPC